MIRYFSVVVLLLALAHMVQLFLPGLDFWGGARFLPLLLVFLCAAVTLPPPAVFLLAFLCGFVVDLDTTISPHGGDPAVYTHPVPLLRFGHSIALYGLAGALMQGIRPLFQRGNWQFPALLVGLSIGVYLLAEYLLINFIREGFILHSATLLKIATSAMITTIFAPLIFWLLFTLASGFGVDIFPNPPVKRRSNAAVP